MRIIIFAVLFWACHVWAELATPPTPVFLRTVLVTGTGATVGAAQQAAREQAWRQTQAGAWTSTAITNITVVTIEKTAQGWQSSMWVTIESGH
jgi:hypothetical protein